MRVDTSVKRYNYYMIQTPSMDYRRYWVFKWLTDRESQFEFEAGESSNALA